VHVPGEDDRIWFADHVLNAIPLAKRWKRKKHPDLVFEGDPMSGSNQLHRYLELIDYTMSKTLDPATRPSESEP
jgi:hypothetical protein